MLGVGMLNSFLVGYLSRALSALSRQHATNVSSQLLAAASPDAHRYRRRPWLAATGRSQSWPSPAARLACS
jgi:hypothetical protein